MKFLRLLPRWLLRRNYRKLGIWLVCAASYAAIAGKAYGYDERMVKFRRYEEELRRRNMPLWSLADFYDCGGYGRDLPPLEEK